MKLDPGYLIKRQIMLPDRLNHTILVVSGQNDLSKSLKYGMKTFTSVYTTKMKTRHFLRDLHA